MVLDAKAILKIHPHKWPFIFLDRVIKLEPGKSAIGIKNVTINEPMFAGHFPSEPIVPGVLIIEMLAQLTAVMYCSEFLPEDGDIESEVMKAGRNELAGRVGYLVDIKDLKFKKVVVPGDKLELHVNKSFGVCKQGNGS